MVEAVAPARLHLGFLDLNGDIGRHYGSIGLAIDEPTTTLRVSRANSDEVTGHEQERTKRLSRDLRPHFNFQIITGWMSAMRYRRMLVSVPGPS